MEIKLIGFVFAFLFGSSWGSFLYTFIVRYSNGTYTQNPLYALTYPSHCPHCKEKIKTLYLIPIAGYFLAKGQCNVCKKPISFIYPLAELISGCIAIVTLLLFDWAIAFVYFIAITISISIAIIDSITMEIPNFLVGILFLAGISLCVFNKQWLIHIQGAALMITVFIVPLLLVKGSFGGGDVKFASVIGFFLGWPDALVALEIALVTGAIYGIGYAMLISKTLKARIPFGPFLTLGFNIAIFFSEDIIRIFILTF